MGDQRLRRGVRGGANSAFHDCGFTALQHAVLLGDYLLYIGRAGEESGVALMRSTPVAALSEHASQSRRYFSGRTIKCLIWPGRRRFRRLSFHLAAKHDVTTDDYKSRFGLSLDLEG